MAMSVGRLAKSFGISRTTLLYYDKIGLLQPSERSDAGYRIYNDKDIDKLKDILLFRDAGISLYEIAQLISNREKSSTTAALLKRLSELNDEIIAVKEQQAVIIKIMQSEAVANIHDMDDKTWLNIKRNAGIDDSKSEKLHAEFEKYSPEQHQKLLEALGHSMEEIKELRQQSKQFFDEKGEDAVE